MASYTISPIWGAGAQLFDNSGNVLTGGKIYTYLAGTDANSWYWANEGAAVLGTNVVSSYNINCGNQGVQFNLLDQSSNLQFRYYNSVNPEGAVSAPPGSIVINKSGGAGTTLYIKETGTGNTGWKGLS